jgi:hypothetical protein
MRSLEILMHMRTFGTSCAGLGVALALAGCGDALGVENRNNPDVARAYGTPTGVQGVIANTFQAIWSANNASFTSIGPGLLNMSFESYSALANSGSNTRNALPRAAIANSRGNPTQSENFRDFSGLSRNSRTAANAVRALDTLIAQQQTIGTPQANARARAFAFFTGGVSLANLALAYDSAAIVTPAVPRDSLPPLSGAADVMTAALAMLDSAARIAPAMGDSLLPSGWINGNTSINAAGFVRIVRSYKARFRAGVARNPTQRAAVDWAAVIADATNGITADLNVTVDPAAGWTPGLLTQSYIQGYSQMTPMIVGMADTSGGYDAWLAQPLTGRTYFLIRTPDKRFPAGETRAAQIANSGTVGAGLLYFRNRPAGEDQSGEAWGVSYYDHKRFVSIPTNASKGTFPLMTKAEVDMLAAEGYLRTNQIGAATALIDVYRSRAGLATLTGQVTSSTSQVPGGGACVPRVPVAPFNRAACGTVFEAMKWEKRMETLFTGWAQWFFDSRGWGDLPQGTPLEYPVPYQEMDARAQPFYDLGGVGGQSAATVGTYGI